MCKGVYPTVYCRHDANGYDGLCSTCRSIVDRLAAET